MRREQGRCLRGDWSCGVGVGGFLLFCCTGAAPWHVCCGVPLAGQECCQAAYQLPRGEFAVRSRLELHSFLGDSRQLQK